MTQPNGPYTIKDICEKAHIARSAYYHWKRGVKGQREQENERLAEEVEKIHEEDPSKGYRRIADDLRNGTGKNPRMETEQGLLPALLQYNLIHCQQSVWNWN